MTPVSSSRTPRRCSIAIGDLRGVGLVVAGLDQALQFLCLHRSLHYRPRLVRSLVLGTRTCVQLCRRALPLSSAERVGPHPSRRRRAVDSDPAQLPAAQGRLPRHLRARRRRSPAALRRGPLRPGHPRPDAAPARRRRSLPPAALAQPGADHHADRQGQRDRQGRRPRGRRRRLHHQAVLDARVPQPRQSGAAPLADGRRDARRGGDRARRADDRLRPPHGHPARARRSGSPTSSSRSSAPSPARPAGC